MDRITLQVPVDKKIKVSAEKVAREAGFSSLQEALRLFMKQFADRQITIDFRSNMPEVLLTPEQEAVLNKKYEEAKRDIDEGRGYTFSNAEEMIAFLDGKE